MCLEPLRHPIPTLYSLAVQCGCLSHCRFSQLSAWVGYEWLLIT